MRCGAPSNRRVKGAGGMKGGRGGWFRDDRGETGSIETHDQKETSKFSHAKLA